MRARFLSLLVALFVFAPAFAADDPPKPPDAKTVKLSGEMTVGEALTQLTAQTKIPVEDRTEFKNKISIHCEKDTFWQALDKIANAADAQVDLYGPVGKLALKKRIGKAPAMGVVSYDGLFRTSIKRITPTIDLEIGETTYWATIEVAWEPTLEPFYLDTVPQNLSVTALGEKDPVPTINLGKSKDEPADHRTSVTFQTMIHPLPRSAKSIGVMSGNLSIIAPSKMVTFTFDGTLKDIDKAGQAVVKKDGVVCTITRTDLKPKRWSISLVVDYPPGNTDLGTSQLLWLSNNGLTLVSLDGKKSLPHTGEVSDIVTARRVPIKYHFDEKDAMQPLGKPEDWKVTYRAPAAVIRIPIKFEFKNVPLP
jgi:hypothetical protein